MSTTSATWTFDLTQKISTSTVNPFCVLCGHKCPACQQFSSKRIKSWLRYILHPGATPAPLVCFPQLFFPTDSMSYEPEILCRPKSLTILLCSCFALQKDRMAQTKKRHLIHTIPLITLPMWFLHGILNYFRGQFRPECL